MIIVLWLLAIQGAMGAFDTLYYHEWQAKLPARIPAARIELRLHAARDFIYAIIFGTLPWVAWNGLWAGILTALLVAEIGITLKDFIVEDRTRRALGGVYPGERATHALMGIVYGGVLAHLIPVLAQWWQMPTALALQPQAIPDALRVALALMAIGVALSGVRDLYASTGLPGSGWPWRVAKGRECDVQP